MMCLALAAVLHLCLVISSGGSTIYVSSQKGSDANSGTTPSAPFRSIPHAIAAVSRLKAMSVLLAGRFKLNETVTLNTRAKGLVIEQWPGEEDAVLSGAVEIDPSAWKRRSDGVWSADLTEAATKALSAKGSGHIFVDGKRRSIVRTKTMHWSDALGPKGSSLNLWGFVFSSGDIDPSWSLKEEHLAQWRVAAFHSWTKAYHTVANVSVEERSIHFAEKASFGYGDYTYCSEKRYYIEGIPELPLTPGSWRMDPGSNGVGASLLYAPAAGENFPAATEVPVLGTIIQVNGVSVTVRNLAIEHAFGGDCGNALGIACDRDNAMMVDATSAIRIQNADSVHISNVMLRNVGGTGIEASGSSGLVIDHVGILDSGGTGIAVYRSPLALINNTIVQGYGVRYPGGIGINLASCRNGTVTHCDISGGLYAGLSGGGVDDTGAFSTYAFNHVHGIGSENDDGVCDGASGYHGTNHGSVLPIYITSNIFHDITAYRNGGSGVYMDVSSAAYQVSRNLIYDVSYAPIIWNINAGTMPTQGPTPTRITNNVLIADRDNGFYRGNANGTRGVFRGWGLGNPVLWWIGHTTAELERNAIVVDTIRAPSRGEWFGGRPCAKDNPASGSCTWNFADNFKKLKSGSNVWFNMTSPSDMGGTSTFPGGCNVTGPDSWKACATVCVCQSWCQWQALGNEVSSLWADPKLTGRYKLVSEERALALGIEPLHELERAGADWEVQDQTRMILI